MILSLFSSVSSHGGGDLQQAQADYLRGVRAYEEKNWAEAQEFFQKSLQIQPRNPQAFYNLGLVEYQQQHLGKALALWRRALFLSPSSLEEAQAAIKFTLRQMSEVPTQEKPLILQYLYRVVNKLSLTDWLLLSALLVLVSGSLFLNYWGRRKRALSMEVSLPSFPMGTSVLSVVCFLFISLSIFKGVAQWQIRATIIVPQAQLRLSPTEDSIVIGRVVEGSEVTLKKKTFKSWEQVVTLDRLVGWLNHSEFWITNKEDNK